MITVVTHQDVTVEHARRGSLSFAIIDPWFITIACNGKSITLPKEFGSKDSAEYLAKRIRNELTNACL